MYTCAYFPWQTAQLPLTLEVRLRCQMKQSIWYNLYSEWERSGMVFMIFYQICSSFPSGCSYFSCCESLTNLGRAHPMLSAHPFFSNPFTISLLCFLSWTSAVWISGFLCTKIIIIGELLYDIQMYLSRHRLSEDSFFLAGFIYRHRFDVTWIFFNCTRRHSFLFLMKASRTNIKAQCFCPSSKKFFETLTLSLCSSPQFYEGKCQQVRTRIIQSTHRPKFGLTPSLNTDPTGVWAQMRFREKKQHNGTR